MRLATLFATLAAVLALAPVRAGEEIALFNGKNMDGWKHPDFSGSGPCGVENGVLVIGQGEVLSGLVYTNATPTLDYEIDAEARRVLGSDFFFALTAPHTTNSFTLVCGGWGGNVTGISSLNHLDASENDTANVVKYEDNRWYSIRMRVQAKTITVWIDGDKLIEADLEGRHIGMRPGDIEKCMPLGLSTYQSKGEVRKLVMRKLAKP